MHTYVHRLLFLVLFVFTAGCTDSLVDSGTESDLPESASSVNNRSLQVLTADLNGENEVGVGDPDGEGIMRVRLNPKANQICFGLKVRNVDTLTRAHIHRGVAGVNGPVEVFFFDTVIPDPIPVPGDLRGCVYASYETIKELSYAPYKFYINIHTEAYPAGAVRGQLQ